jgi:hypothetical protein
MYLRLTLALALAVLLVGTHWKAYVAGQGAVRAELTAQALKLSEMARQREQMLLKTVEIQDRELQKQKARNAAVDRAHAERLRGYQAALDRATADPRPSGGTAGPFARIASECGSALTALDQHARGLAATARALQDYATGVCITVPDRALKGSE